MIIEYVIKNCAEGTYVESYKGYTHSISTAILFDNLDQAVEYGKAFCPGMHEIVKVYTF